MIQKSGVVFKKGEKKAENPSKEVKEEIEKKINSKEEKELEEVVEKEKTILYTGKTLFPLDFFPDKITINLDSISIHKREFFKSERIKAYDFTDYDDIVVEHGPVSSTVRLVKSGVKESETVIRHLSHKDAITIGKIVGGILKAKKEHINLTKIYHKEIRKKIEELGEIYE